MTVNRTLAALAIVVSLGVAVAAKPKAPVKKGPAPKSSAAIVHGKKVYQQSQCAMCHGVPGKGGRMDLGRIGKEKKAPWLRTQVRNPKRNNPSSAMPPYNAKRLNDKDLSDLVAYLSSLK